MAAGSIPFIVLLSRCASWFGLRKKDGLLIGLVLTTEVMLLPLALRYNLVMWWLGITALTTFLPPLWLAKPFHVTEGEAVPEPADSFGPADHSNLLEAVVEFESVVPHQSEPALEITLEDLINCGFAAKNAGRSQSAAEWFSRALSLHPAPDLAFYLIMDACSLWLTVNKRDQAQELLRHYWPEYERLFASEQRTQLSAWLSKENLLS